MLFVISLIELVLIFVKSTDVDSVRKKLFSFSIILSLFFFSSCDPIIGMPLYVYSMFLSVVLSLIYHPKLKRYLIFILILLFVSMMIPLIRMGWGIGTERYLLIKDSITDVLSLNDQLFIPTVDFTVIKHFIFMLVYAVFVIVNADIVKDNNYVKTLLDRLILLFKILFIGIIIEWTIVNIFGGINDRDLMGWIFSLKTNNQTENWSTWGSHSVALWFTERSNFNIVALFYMICLKKKNIAASEWFWIILSIIATYCTGASSCLVILVVYLFMEVLTIVIRNKKISQFILALFIVASCLMVLLSNMELFMNKIDSFLHSNIETWGSGFFRANSITYGIKAIKDHFLFGVGIGTVLVHSMLIQTLANIGFAGTFLMLWLHYLICPIKCNLVNILSSVFIVGISYGCYMVQNFTSPFLIIIFIILNCSEEILDAKQNSKDDSLLLVWRKTSS